MILVAAGVGFAATWALLAAGLRPGGRSTPWLVVTLDLVALAALAALFTTAEPTGVGPVDTVARAGYAALLAWCGAKARRTAVLASATVAVVTLAWVSSPLDVAATGALGVAAAVAVHDRRGKWLSPFGALAGGALALFTLSLEGPARTGLPTLAGAAVAAPLVWSAWRRSTPVWRSRTARIAVGTAGAAVVASVATLVAAAQAAGPLEDAVAEAEAGLEVLADVSRRDDALVRLQRAADGFRDGRRTVDAWWARPGRLVPVVAQHARAASAMANGGAELADAAVRTLELADPDRLRLEGGQLDVTLLDELSPRLQRARRALETTQRNLREVASPWLVSLLEEYRADLAGRVDEALPRAVDVADGAEVARTMLGADRPRRYLLLMMTLSESRGIGGWPGSFGLLETDRGRITLARTGRTVADLKPARPLVVDAPEEFLARYQFTDLTAGMGRASLGVDFPTVARIMTGTFPQVGGEQVDGVIAIDPVGISALLTLSGPVTVDGWDEPITAENAVEVLSFQQYDRLDTERPEFLADVTEAVWTRLTDGALPPPQDLIDVLAPMVTARHIQVFSLDDAEQAFFVRTGAAGAVPPVRGDGFGLITQQLGENKIDWYLRRAIDYRVSWDPATGALGAVATVRLTNLAPASGVSPNVISYRYPGISQLWFNWYSPQQLLGATIDGEPLTVVAQTELGRNVYWANIVIPPGETVTLELRLRGELPPGAPYRLDVFRQPTLVPDDLTVRVDLPPGWEAAAVTGGLSVTPSGAAARLEQDRPGTFTVVPHAGGRTP